MDISWTMRFNLDSVLLCDVRGLQFNNYVKTLTEPISISVAPTTMEALNYLNLPVRLMMRIRSIW